jgi:hypothetical protein
MVRVLLELDPGEMLSGRFQGPTGEVEPFRGWLDLAGRLERVRPASAAGALNEAGERPSPVLTADGSGS